MSERSILKTKNRMKFELELAEIGCIKAFLQEQSRNVKMWGNEISGMEDWQANVLHRLADEFNTAEEELQNHIHGELIYAGQIE